MTENKVFTIIVTYNAMKWIKRCLDALSDSTVSTSIVVVDNASTDETIQYIRKNYPFVHIIENNANKVERKKCNRSYQHSKYRCLWIGKK